MNIVEWFKSDQVKALHDVEQTLLRRRRAGQVAGTLALLWAAVQFATTLSQQGFASNLLDSVWYALTLQFGELFRLWNTTPYTALGWLAFFLAAALYLMLRRTGVLLPQAREAFRYTFWIEPLQLVADTPGDRCVVANADQFALLRHDLMERLDQRIRRFSLLKDAAAEDGGAETDNKRQTSAHIHISGHIAIRETKNKNWVVHVMPTVRVGPPGAPATLARAIRYPLRKTEKGYTLSPRAYMQIVERVYSSIATEVYRRIDADVREKNKLYPTAHLKMIALYYEAEDFARSNTVDAYERATALYREVLRYFELTRLRRLTKWLVATRPLLWRLEIKHQHEWARVVAGYARCLVYRHKTSNIAGRESKPVFEAPELLADAIGNLERLHEHIGARRGNSQLDRMVVYATYPKDSWLNFITGRSDSRLFDAQRNALFDLYVADALVQSVLDCRERAHQRLEDAAATAPDRIATDPVYLVVKGMVEPVIEKQIVYLRQAVDLAPDFQMARWSLANAHERGFRQQDEMTAERARAVINEYRNVLTLNYGNVLALSAEAYLQWLVHKGGNAQRSLREGRKIKAISQETFIGELSYRLARIAAEAGRFEECRALYLEAVAADPSIGAHYPGRESRATSSDFEDIGLSMLRRYESYRATVEQKIAAHRAARAGSLPEGSASVPSSPLSEDTLRLVEGFVLNDFGNACLRYFHHHGDNSYLTGAITAFESACRVNATDARPWFNLQNAYGWSGQSDRVEACYKRARELAPTWTSVAKEAAKVRARTLSEERGREHETLTELKDKITKRNVELVELRRNIVAMKAVAANLANANKAPLLLPAHAGATLPTAALGGEQPQLNITPVRAQFAGSTLHKQAAPLEENATELITQWQQRNAELEGELRDWEAEVVACERRCKLVDENFDAAIDEALLEIRRSSRLGSMLEGKSADYVDRLIAVPWGKLDGHDVETMIHLAEVLAVHRGNECRAVVKLAEHLMKMLPEQYQVAGVLLEVLPRLLPPEDADSTQPDEATASWRALLQQAKRQNRQIYVSWLETNPRTFLAHYWHAQLAPEEQLPHDVVKARYFGAAPDTFEDLWGWALFHNGSFVEAADAFRRAIELRPNNARYHFHLGQCLYRNGDYKGARSAYVEACRLDPQERRYQLKQAEAVNQIANAHWSDDEYADAADYHRQACILAPEIAVYHRNYGLDMERANFTDLGEALRQAASELRHASTLTPNDEDVKRELRRVETRGAALYCYGQPPTADIIPSMPALGIDYSPDLRPLLIDANTGKVFTAIADAMQVAMERVSMQYGIGAPKVFWRENDLDAYHISILLYESPFLEAPIYPDRKLAIMPNDEMRARFSGEAATDPLTGDLAWWLEEDAADTAREEGVTIIEPIDYVIRHVEATAVANLHELLHLRDVVKLLDTSVSAEVKAIAKSRDQLIALASLFTGLLSERTPVAAPGSARLRIHDRLCYLFLDHFGSKSQLDIMEDMRMLERVRPRLWGNSGEFLYFQVGPDVCQVLKSGIREAPPVRFLALGFEECQRTLTSVRESIAECRHAALVVDEPEIRVHARNLIQVEFPNVPVLSRRELLPHIEVQPEPITMS